MSFPPSLSHDFKDKLPEHGVAQAPAKVEAPSLVRVNRPLAEELGIDLEDADDKQLARFFAGQDLPASIEPVAQAYAGHQFGQLNPQLGDGRAVLLGGTTGGDGKLYDIQLKGSGRTPFSRGGDGLAAIGPVLREYLVAEAMHALGVPTTRALAAVTTGGGVWRDEGALPGAILTRVASSHIRVGTFQFFAIRGQRDELQALADYAIARHYPEIDSQGLEGGERWLAFFDAVAARQAKTVAAWMGLGFVHGVMNTDNMAVSGETIDYGPCAFMEAFSEKTVFSSIDAGARYAYAQQPVIAQWNLARLAESLLVLEIEGELDSSTQPDEALVEKWTDRVDRFGVLMQQAMEAVFAAKLGRQSLTRMDIDALFETLEGQGVDFTTFFRALAEELRGKQDAAADLFADRERYRSWAKDWRAALDAEGHDPKEVANAMDRVNPLYIPRNHMVEQALTAARSGDYSLWEAMLEVVTAPYEARDEWADYAKPAPDHAARYVTFCGT